MSGKITAVGASGGGFWKKPNIKLNGLQMNRWAKGGKLSKTHIEQIIKNVQQLRPNTNKNDIFKALKQIPLASLTMGIKAGARSAAFDVMVILDKLEPTALTSAKDQLAWYGKTSVGLKAGKISDQDMRLTAHLDKDYILLSKNLKASNELNIFTDQQMKRWEANGKDPKLLNQSQVQFKDNKK